MALSLVGVGLAAALASCQLETSGNGLLDGYWQLTAIDTLETGGHTDMREELVMWAVQGRLMQLRWNSDSVYGVYFSFTHMGDSLIMTNPYISKRELDDIKVFQPEELFPYGVHNLEEHFLVEKLNRKNMQLCDGVYRLYFRRY